MFDSLNINKGFEAMLPKSKEPEREEVEESKVRSVSFTLLNWRFEISFKTSRVER